MKATVRWVNGMKFEGTADSGHQVTMDGPPDSGGENLGFRPMEMLLMGAGSCSSVDVIGILKKTRQQVTDCSVEISAERAETIPKVFTKIHMHFVVTGTDLKPDVVERAISLSTEKYCSATLMLGKTAEITSDFEIQGEKFPTQS